MIKIDNNNPKVRVLASDHSWIEGEALQQLQKTSRLAGMHAVVGLPDLHPGRGNPIGAAFLARRMIYPYLIGNDVGCGMGLFQTSLKRNKVKRDKWVKKLQGLQHPWQGDLEAWLEQHDIETSDHDLAHGTLGGGNHFAELQMVEKIHKAPSLTEMGLDKSHLLLLVHSGSRGLGDALLRKHTERFGADGMTEAGDEAQCYLQGHDKAVRWARFNRALIAQRFLDQLNSERRSVLDICHNSVTAVEMEDETYWLHRKGAAPSDSGPIVVPGTRGDLSYLIEPVGDQQQNLWSLAHGAGRKWNRTSARQRVKAQFNAKRLRQTELGSVVICEDRDLLFEEAPQAYKKIETVIEDMVTAGLARVIATLRPLITYKMRQRE